MGSSMQGKTALVLGVANKRSIAWSCAKALAADGARVALTYAGERLEKPVRSLAEELEGSLVLPCDVTDPASVDALFESLQTEFGALDAMVHAIAYARREELAGRFIDTTRDGYALAHEVSSWSLVDLARRAQPLMEGREGSIVTLTYLGSERVIPNYNVMGTAKAALEAAVRYLAHDLGPAGVRVNAISAGPIRTLSASGVKDFGSIIDRIAETAPLRRNVTAADVGAAARFLLGPDSSAITGTTLYVDCGFHVMGVS